MSNHVRRRVSLLVAAAVATASGHAIAQTTHHVPADFATIQAAIDAAIPGDTVLVADGTYTGGGNQDLTLNGKAITVRSANGAAACIIDCANTGRGFFFNDGETGAAVIDGFTIINGDGFNGGGIACENGSSPTIRNCVISNCFADDAGGGIYCANGSSPSIENCVLTNNRADDDDGGGAIACYGSSPTIDGCVLVRNLAAAGGGFGGGVLVSQGGASPVISNTIFFLNRGRDGGGLALYNGAGNVQITNCLFVRNIARNRNGGGALFCDGGSLTVQNCTITENRAQVTNSGATPQGAAILGFNAAPVTINSSILWGNIQDDNGALIPNEIDGSAVFTVEYSDVEGGFGGTGNIDADPLLVDPDGADDDPNSLDDNDYSLTGDGPVSPCIDAGDPTPPGPTADLAGNPRVVGAAVDMGAYEFGVPDSDGDGLTDADEAIYGTDPGDPDTDDDGLFDGTEVDTAAGTGCPDPLNADSDGDGLSDGTEVALTTNPCSADSDGDGIPDNIDPLPTDPGGTSGYLETELRALCDDIAALDLSLFAGPNNNANRGRRNALSNRACAAANEVANGNYDEAIDVLENLQKFVDGIEPPPEWMIDCPERDDVYDRAADFITIIEYL